MNLEYLKKYNKILVIGHNNPDVDTIVSSKILSEIFNYYGIKSDYAVIEGNNLKETDLKLINECMEYNPLIINKNDINNYNYFLVDHNDVYQSVKDESLIVGCIDHHENIGYKTALISDYCATAIYIYDLFKDKYLFNEQQKYQIYMAFLSDSRFGKSIRCKEKDKLLTESLGFGSNYDKMFEKFFIVTNLKNQNFAFNNNGFKYYKKYNLSSTYIERLDIDNLKEYKNFVRRKKDNFLGIWVDYKNNKTYSYLKYNNNFTSFDYDFIGSRAKHIMSDVIKYITTLK